MVDVQLGFGQAGDEGVEVGHRDSSVDGPTLRWEGRELGWSRLGRDHPEVVTN